MNKHTLVTFILLQSLDFCYLETLSVWQSRYVILYGYVRVIFINILDLICTINYIDFLNEECIEFVYIVFGIIPPGGAAIWQLFTLKIKISTQRLQYQLN